MDARVPQAERLKGRRRTTEKKGGLLEEPAKSTLYGVQCIYQAVVINCVQRPGAAEWAYPEGRVD